MMDGNKEISGKRAGGGDKAPQPAGKGGDSVRQAQEFSGGSKAAKGSVTHSDKRNQNSSAKS